MYVGSDDGVYRVSTDSGDRAATQVLDAGRVMRLRRLPGVAGVLAATATGLYRSTDGRRWTDLGVPRDRVYGVGADRTGRLYAGTRPAHLYVSAPSPDGETEWHELDGFQRLPSRDTWRLPRHEDLAQVRDVHLDPGGAEGPRLVAGVEVGGVHVSEDGGETWVERREGVDDDVHELQVAGPGEYVAATGRGLYRSTDAGRSWTRLDEGVRQRYFRTALDHDGTVYAGGALANSSTWNDADTDHGFVAYRDGTATRVGLPVDEVVTGMTTRDGRLFAATHGGHVLRREGEGDWTVVGAVPVTGDVTGRYTPLCPA